jgi:hypothetical protein
MARYTDADRTTIEHEGSYIPVAPGNNRDYDALIASGLVIEPFREPAVTAADVDAEYDSRLSAALGSPAKQASMQREKSELQAMVVAGQELTPEQIADAAVMGNLNRFESRLIEIREGAKKSLPKSLAEIAWIAPTDIDKSLTSEFLTAFLSGY